MTGTVNPGAGDPHHDQQFDGLADAGEARLVEPIEHLLAPPAVWLDPPAELGDEVIGAVLDEIA